MVYGMNNIRGEGARCVETVTEPDIDGSVSISSYSLASLVLHKTKTITNR